jgi:hypothetical protein
VSPEGTTQFTARTGVVYEIKCKELDWDEDGMGEDPMGGESQHKAVLDILIWGLLFGHLESIQSGPKTTEKQILESTS